MYRKQKLSKGCISKHAQDSPVISLACFLSESGQKLKSHNSISRKYVLWTEKEIIFFWIEIESCLIFIMSKLANVKLPAVKTKVANSTVSNNRSST